MAQRDRIKHDFTVGPFLSNKINLTVEVTAQKGPNASVERVAFQRRYGQ